MTNFVDPLLAAKTLIDKKGVDLSKPASAYALIAIAEELQTLNMQLEKIVMVLCTPTWVVKEVAHGGSVSVPGATGVPGAPTTIPHQTPAPHGHEDDDGGSS